MVRVEIRDRHGGVLFLDLKLAPAPDGGLAVSGHWLREDGD